jgi:hypothetical protein
MLKRTIGYRLAPSATKGRQVQGLPAYPKLANSEGRNGSPLSWRRAKREIDELNKLSNLKNLFEA